MHGVICELNQPLVLRERTKTSPSFSSRIIYSLSYTCDNDCFHLQRSQMHTGVFAWTLHFFFQHFNISWPHTVQNCLIFLEKGVSLTFMPLTFSQNHGLGNSIIFIICWNVV